MTRSETGVSRPRRDTRRERPFRSTAGYWTEGDLSTEIAITKRCGVRQDKCVGFIVGAFPVKLLDAHFTGVISQVIQIGAYLRF